MDDISRNALARARGALDVVAAGPGQSAGRSVGRLIRSLAMSDDMDAAAAFIEAQNWVEKDAIGRVMKAAVPGLHLGSLPADTITADFMAALRPYAVLSRLDKARRVPTKTRVIAFGAGAAAFRVGERKPIPISRASLVGIQIDSKPKVAGVSLATRELLAVPGIETDIALGLDLAAATGAAEDAVFLDPTVTGSILNGAPTAVSVGVNTTGVDADLQKASPAYAELRKTMPEDAAKREIGANLQRNLPEVAITGLVGALSGKFGPEAMVTGVAPNYKMGRVGSAVLGFADEGLLEGGTEQVASNYGVQKAIPSQSLIEGVGQNIVAEGMPGIAGVAPNSPPAPPNGFDASAPPLPPAPISTIGCGNIFSRVVARVPRRIPARERSTRE